MATTIPQEMAPSAPAIGQNQTGEAQPKLQRERLVAVGGILGALAASSCCVLPLVLFGLGVSGAWIGNLTALAPYKPYVAAVTLGLLGYGYYLVYWKPARACAVGDACTRPLPNRFIKIGLWVATVLVIAAIAFDYVAPLLLDV